MSHQQALEQLTEGYASVAQMTIALADALGFIANPDYVVIIPDGDSTSAGLPFIIEPKRTNTGHYEFSSYDATGFNFVPPNTQVLVYREASPLLPTISEQIELLRDFAAQFPPDSLIAILLNDNLLEWLIIHQEHPDIWHEWAYMNQVAYRLEGHVDDLDEIF